MTFWRRKIPPPLWQAALCAALLSWAVAGNSQVGPTERTFRVPKQKAEKALELPDHAGVILDLQVYYLLQQIYSQIGESALARKYADLARSTPIPPRGR